MTSLRTGKRGAALRAILGDALVAGDAAAAGAETALPGVVVRPLSVNRDPRGTLTELLRADWAGVFGDGLRTFPVDKMAATSVFAAVEALDAAGKEIGQETENGIWLFWDQAIREKQHWDHVFVYSDMQAGHGGLYGTDPKQYADYLWGGGGNSGGRAASRGGVPYIDVPKLVQAYRERVNPRVMVYLVQVAGYQDTIVPEFYDRTFILGGWGEGLLRFAAQMSEMSEMYAAAEEATGG